MLRRRRCFSKKRWGLWDLKRTAISPGLYLAPPESSRKLKRSLIFSAAKSASFSRDSSSSPCSSSSPVSPEDFSASELLSSKIQTVILPPDAGAVFSARAAGFVFQGP
jgi:hypothetical protein